MDWWLSFGSVMVGAVLGVLCRELSKSITWYRAQRSDPTGLRISPVSARPATNWLIGDGEPLLSDSSDEPLDGPWRTG
jgi:hypothetical protein